MVYKHTSSLLYKRYLFIQKLLTICHNLYNNFRQKLKLPLFVTMNRSHVPPSCFYEFLFVGHIFFRQKKCIKKSFGWADNISKMLIHTYYFMKNFLKNVEMIFFLWVINLTTNYKFLELFLSHDIYSKISCLWKIW